MWRIERGSNGTVYVLDGDETICVCTKPEHAEAIVKRHRADEIRRRRRWTSKPSVHAGKWFAVDSLDGALFQGSVFLGTDPDQPLIDADAAIPEI